MSIDYKTIMESIIGDNIPMMKNVIDVYAQYESEIVSLARKHRLRPQEVVGLHRKLSERLDIDSNIFHHKLDFECYCYVEKKHNPSAKESDWLDNIIKNMTPDERFKFIENVLNESLEIEKRTKDINPDDNISKLKKRIKYSKNPLERISLERQLNKAYKKRKQKKDKYFQMPEDSEVKA